MLEAARDTLSSPVIDVYSPLALRELTRADLEAGRHAEALTRYRERLPGLFEDPPKLALRLQYDSALESAVSEVEADLVQMRQALEGEGEAAAAR